MVDSPSVGRYFAESCAILRRPITWIVWGLCTLMVALAGPFGSFEAMGAPLRLLYWGVVTGLGVVLGLGASAAALVVTGFNRPMRQDLLAAALTVVPLAPAVRLLRGSLDPTRGVPDLALAPIALNTFGIVAGVLLLRRVIAGALVTPEMTEARLMRRLPETARGRILRLSSRDHFVEVVTSAGRETLRLRLADAIAEAEPEAGLCTHRSHWVAIAAISGVARGAGNKVLVVLCNGDRVPVSRRYLPDLRQAGWPDPGRG